MRSLGFNTFESWSLDIIDPFPLYRTSVLFDALHPQLSRLFQLVRLKLRWQEADLMPSVGWPAHYPSELLVNGVVFPVEAAHVVVLPLFCEIGKLVVDQHRLAI